jgi:SAM-dependent methyltransferase
VRDPYRDLAGVYDEIVVDPCHSDWADYLDALWADDDVDEVLDVCCGSGLMTAELVDRGYRVVGVDASEAMLARARNRLGPAAALLSATLPDLPEDGPFDAAVSTLDGLNYLRPAEFSDTMQALAARLRPGGWLVFDVHADGAIPFLQERPEIHGTHGAATYTLTTRVDPELRRFTSVLDYRSTNPRRSFNEEHVQYVHSAEHIRKALESAGVRVQSVTDEYTDRPVGPSTLRATWVARRAAE